MENFSNINYDPIKVYSDFKESKPDINSNKLDPDIEDLTKDNKSTNNPTSIDSMHTIKKSDFHSLCSPFVASKQTQVVIWNKLMTKVDDKFNEVHIDLWGPHYLVLIQNLHCNLARYKDSKNLSYLSLIPRYVC